MLSRRRSSGRRRRGGRNDCFRQRRTTVAAAGREPPGRRRHLADLCGQRRDDMGQTAVLSSGCARSRRPGFTHYEFWPWRNKDIDAIVALNQRAGPDARPVLGVAGQGFWPRHHQSRPGAAGRVRRGDPVGDSRGQEAGGQEDLRGGRRGNQAAIRATTRSRPSSPRSRPAPGSSSPRGSRSSSSP